MKFFASSSVFKFSWDQVTSAFWNKYPNPHSNHVLSEDIVSRKIEQGKLLTKRIIMKTNKLPKWGELFVPGQKHGCIIEESVVDPKTKTMTTYTRNVSLSKVMLVEEKCVYRPSSENKGWTECHKQAWISSSMYGFSRPLQAFGYERMKNNMSRATKGFEYVLHRMYVPDMIPDQPALLSNFSKEKLKEKAKSLATSKGVPITT